MQPEKSAGRYTMKEAHQHLKFFSLAFSKTQMLLKTPQELNQFAVLSVSSEVGSLHFCPNKHRLRAARTKSENWPKTRGVCRLVSSASRHREKRFLPPTPCPGSWQAASGKSHGAHPLHGLLRKGESSISSCHQLRFCSVMEQAKRTQGKIITTFLQKKSSKSFLVNCMHRKSFVWALIFIKTIPLPMSIKGHYRLHDISGL